MAEFTKATEANEKGNEFEFAVTFFTLVLFLAGVSVVVHNDRLRLVLIVIAGLVLLGSGSYLGTLDWTS